MEKLKKKRPKFTVRLTFSFKRRTLEIFMRILKKISRQERRAETLSPGRGQRLPGWLDENEADLLLASLEKFEMSGKRFAVFRIPNFLFGAIQIKGIRDA